MVKADPEVGNATPVPAQQAAADPTLPWKALAAIFFLAVIALAAGLGVVSGRGGGNGGGSNGAPFPTLALDSRTVHWGYFSKYLQPVMTVASGDTVTVEMATHHACDDCASPRPCAAARRRDRRPPRRGQDDQR